MFHYRQIMGDEKIGQAELSLQIHQQVKELSLNRDIERRNGFICHNQFGSQRQRTSDADALALPPLNAYG